ncbi:hypothetical protein FRB90_001417 [Tulasnella sp. 427]|nr:hypothetical protein FRB90_001417 [Tulasnella sp. 427]
MSRQILAYDDLVEPVVNPAPPYNRPEGRLLQSGGPVGVDALDAQEERELGVGIGVYGVLPDDNLDALLGMDEYGENWEFNRGDDPVLEPAAAADTRTPFQRFAMGESLPESGFRPGIDGPRRVDNIRRKWYHNAHGWLPGSNPNPREHHQTRAARFIAQRKPIEVVRKEKAEKKKAKLLAKQQKQQGQEHGGEALHGGEAETEAGQGEDGERKRKKRKFEESVEHNRVHWDAQGEKQYGAVEVNYDDDDDDDEAEGGAADGPSTAAGRATGSTSNGTNASGPATSSRSQTTYEDALESMLVDAEEDSETKDVEPSSAAKPEAPSASPATQQAKNKEADKANPKAPNKDLVGSGGGKVNASTKKDQKAGKVEAPPADPTALLTDADAWDDSVLIEAWDAALEEYQILNGPEADWKKDPVHKSSMTASRPNLRWHDITPSAPQDNATPSGQTASKAQAGADDEGDHQMEAEEQTYEASSSRALNGTIADPQVAGAIPTAFDFTKMSKDDIFQKAVEASYWAGYWAAAYHTSTNASEGH